MALVQVGFGIIGGAFFLHVALTRSRKGHARGCSAASAAAAAATAVPAPTERVEEEAWKRGLGGGEECIVDVDR